MEKKVELGQRFGSLVVIAKKTTAKGEEMCFCSCDCGKIGFSTHSENLLAGKTQNCSSCRRNGGCTTQGALSKHPLHRVWTDMISRCENPNRQYYYLYGGRGIKVCQEWRNTKNGYVTFYNWAIENGYKFEPIEKKPNAKRVRNKWALDRIDVNGDYCPENCRFADIRTQNENKRDCLTIEHRGEKATVKTFLKRYNATKLFFYHLLREGMKEEEAVEYIATLCERNR